MRHLPALVKRNITLYFSDKVSVFFSLLGAIIVLLLVGIFLRGNLIDGIMAASPDYIDREGATALLATWLVPSACAIASFSTGLGGLSHFVSDRETKRWRDFVVTPLPRWVLTMGYIVAAIAISAMMTTAVYIIGVAWCLSSSVTLDLSAVAVTWGWLLLCCLGFTALAAAIVGFVMTSSSFASVSIVVGVVTGFINGTYVSAGVLSDSVNNVLNSLPFAQAASLVRGTFMADTLAPFPDAVSAGVREAMGVTLVVGGETVQQWVIVAVPVGMTLVCSVVSWRLMAQKAKGGTD